MEHQCLLPEELGVTENNMLLFHVWLFFGGYKVCVMA
jgi:hypothetical protein